MLAVLFLVWVIFSGLSCQIVANKFQGELIEIIGPRIYRKGATITLNCTSKTKLYGNQDLKWTKGGKPFPAIPLKNNTLQLIRHNANMLDDGEYRCSIVQQKHVVRSIQIHITIGVPPNNPSNVSWKNINNRICVSWSAESNTRDFTVTYKIRYRCVTECDPFLDNDDFTAIEVDSSNRKWQVDCQNTPHHPTNKMHCCLRDVNLFEKYEAVVMATNLIGMSSSEKFNFIRDIQSTPSPPTSLKLKAEGYGVITIEWSTQDTIWNTKYCIFYRSEEEKMNKTIITADNGQKYYRISGLRPFTKYIIHVAAIDHFSSTIGMPVGPVSIVTREENPCDAPRIIEWYSSLYSDNSKVRNVTIKWKLPSKETWNGKLTNYIIQYRQRLSHFNSKKPWGRQLQINDSSAGEGTIVDIRVDSEYEVEMQMCNRKGCGGIGNRVVIDSHDFSGQVSGSHAVVGKTSILYISLAAVFFALVAVIVFIITKQRRKRPSRTEPEQSFSTIANLKAEYV